VPCPIALPATGGDVPSEVEQIDGFIRQGAGAVLIRPGQDDWPLVPFVCDRLLAAVAARGLPLYCLERYVSLQQVAELAGRYPQLPLIVANVAYRSQRALLPLLEGYPNVYLALGNNFTVHRGIEQMVERLGPRQLLFGTGFPAAEPMMAVTQLMFAEIAPHAKTQIGSGNFARLQEGICRGD
jgi:predicted TIM-barrel fold metal-dependent hydrolase